LRSDREKSKERAGFAVSSCIARSVGPRRRRGGAPSRRRGDGRRWNLFHAIAHSRATREGRMHHRETVILDFPRGARAVRARSISYSRAPAVGSINCPFLAAVGRGPPLPPSPPAHVSLYPCPAPGKRMPGMPDRRHATRRSVIRRTPWTRVKLRHAGFARRRRGA
jgi:hypothetical protein